MQYFLTTKRVFFVVLIALCVLLSAQGAEIKSVMKSPTPYLVTAAGQTPDALMVKIISERQSLPFIYKNMASVNDLEGMETLLLVMGVSMKGLGSAGLNMDQELIRIEQLIQGARSKEMRIIGMFAGGAGGRGGRDQITDQLLARIAPKVDQLVVIKSGDRDGFLLNISQTHNIPLFYMNTVVDMTNTIVRMFR